MDLMGKSLLCCVCLLSCAATGLSVSANWTDGEGSVVYVIAQQNLDTRLLCPTDMFPEPNITFYKNGEEFSERPIGKIRQVKNGIKLPDVQEGHDEGNYTCVVQNNRTVLRRVFIVTVKRNSGRSPPVILLYLENTTAYAGDGVTLRIRVFSTPNVHISWVKHFQVNGSYIDENETAYVHVLQTGDKDHLSLNNLSVNDSGWYTCVISNMFGSSQSSAYLDVLPVETTTQTVIEKDNILVIIAVSATAFFIFAVTACVVILCYCKRWPQKSPHLAIIDNILYVARLPAVPLDPVWEINRSRLRVGELLGEGAFGKVYKGYLRSAEVHSERELVAVKMLKDDATEKELADLVKEMNVMKSISRNGQSRHINIIGLIGCCTQDDGPVQMIVEYAPYGNLRDYLHQRAPAHADVPDVIYVNEQQSPSAAVSYKNLISYAYQIARGMEYLASVRIVHRDLAARNILVGNDRVMKIADFGLTRMISVKDYYVRNASGRLPVKWMAPESLFRNRYTTKSDVWSYGILLWEIFTYGSNPYPSVNVEDLFRLVQAGYRMEKPQYATDEVYEVMMWCWRECPDERPKFFDIVRRLDGLVSQSVGMTYLNLTSLPDVEDDDNEVFDDAAVGNSLLTAERATPVSSDSQYASLTSSERANSPPRSVRSHVVSVV